MRDRLIELISQADEECKHTKDCKHCSGYGKGSMCMNYHIADHLLANGVIVPPCKVGDTVYELVECSCENVDGNYTECEFYGYGEDDKICIRPNYIKCLYQYRIKKLSVTELNVFGVSRCIGKTVFLTREEAERALKGGAE